MERDFDMYIGDSDGWSPEEETIVGTEQGADVAPAVAVPPVDTPPVEAAPAVADVANQSNEELMDQAWQDSQEEAKVPVDAWWEVSWDELQRMLDELNVDSADAEESTQEIKQTVEDMKSTVPEDNAEMQAKLEDLTQKLVEKEAEEMKSRKTVEVLKTEYEKLLNEKIGLEYWTASDSRIAQLVNEDADVKNLIAAKMATDENAIEKAKEAWKMGWENASGVKLDEIISANKAAETGAMSSEEDAAVSLGGVSDDMYI